MLCLSGGTVLGILHDGKAWGGHDAALPGYPDHLFFPLIPAFHANNTDQVNQNCYFITMSTLLTLTLILNHPPATPFLVFSITFYFLIGRVKTSATREERL